MAGVNDNLIPAKPGEIRNPNGKPKGTIHLSTRIQNMLNDDEFTATMVGSDGQKIEFKGNPAEAIIRTALLKSMSGDKKWAEWLAKYGFGLKQIHEFQNNPVQEILQKYGLDNAEEQLKNETKETKPEVVVGDTSDKTTELTGKDNIEEEKNTDAGQDTPIT